MSAKAKRTQRVERPLPEFKVGPLHGGIGVAVWRNVIETEHGPRTIRSITIAPRRYIDPDTGQWRDAASYRPGDLSGLILALEKTREFVISTPLPDETSEDDRLVGTELVEIPPSA